MTFIQEAAPVPSDFVFPRISAKTQQIINYYFSQMASHILLQACVCPWREEDFSVAESGLCFYTRLSDLNLLTWHQGLQARGDPQLKMSLCLKEGG